MRGVLVCLAVVGAFVVCVLGGWRSWAYLDAARVRVPAGAAAEAPGVFERLPVALFARWRARLRPGDSWWLEVPKGRPEGLSNRGAVYRAFATYWFLPAVPAASALKATVVFRTGSAR